MKMLQVLPVSLFLLLCACSKEAPSPPLPLHTVASKTSLAPKNGHRVEIHVQNAMLTKDDCQALIRAYRKDAGPEGQVSVRKPDKRGILQPWGVDNMDGKGIIFNDAFFR